MEVVATEHNGHNASLGPRLCTLLERVQEGVSVPVVVQEMDVVDNEDQRSSSFPSELYGDLHRSLASSVSSPGVDGRIWVRTFSNLFNARSISSKGPASLGSFLWNNPAKES